MQLTFQENLKQDSQGSEWGAGLASFSQLLLHPKSDHFLLRLTSPLGMVGAVLRAHVFLGAHKNVLISSEISRKI